MADAEKPRRYISEFGLNMINGWAVLLQQDQLAALETTNIDFRIYIIAQRPRITLVPETVRITASRVTGEFRKQGTGGSRPIVIPFDVPNLLQQDSLTLECPYPHTEFSFRDAAGTIVSRGKTALLLATFGHQYWHHLDLEVLYVGQAFGREGDRSAADRLRSHETLQRVYAELINRAPENEIWLVLFTFEPMMLSSFDGRKTDAVSSLKEDDAHIKKVFAGSISERQQIAFTEAALIRYFQPRYNRIFRDTFPNPEHSTYRECYDIELNMVSVELQTDELGVRLWSQSAEPDWIHFCTFPLHSREDRVYMFDLDGTRLI